MKHVINDIKNIVKSKEGFSYDIVFSSYPKYHRDSNYVTIMNTLTRPKKSGYWMNQLDDKTMQKIQTKMEEIILWGNDKI